MKNSKKSLSETLHNFLQNIEGDSFTVFEVTAALKEKSFGFLLLFLALPNALLIAAMPGISSFFGLALILISLQMILCLKQIWVPKRIGNKTFSKAYFMRLLVTYKPYLLRIEKSLKVRWTFLMSIFFEVIIGFICLIHGVLIALPIPFGNFLPGVALLFLSLGILASDGLFILIGCFLSFGIFAFFSTTFVLILETIHKLLG